MDSNRLKRIAIGVFLFFFLMVLLTYRIARTARWVR